MTLRKPIPGQDIGAWGEILNAYLDALTPGPGEVVIGGDGGPEKVALMDLGIQWPPRYSEVDRTLSVVGDLHFGFGSNSEQRAAATARMQVTASDLATLGNTYNRRVYVGDLVETPGTTGTTPGANDLAVLSWMNALDDDWDAVAGNHDITTGRNADHWAQVYGYASPNWSKDYGPFRVIGLASDGPAPTSLLSPGTLAFLDNELSAHSKDTIILCHFPLWGTVAPHPDDKGYTSFGDKATGTDHVLPDADVRAILDRHAHARVWLCGHSHSPVTAPGIFTSAWTGSREIISINAGSPVYTDGNAGAMGGDPPRSIFLTMTPGGVVVRVRNHEAGMWERSESLAWDGPSDNPSSMAMRFDGNITAFQKSGPAPFDWAGPEVYESINGAKGLSLSLANSLKVDPREWIGRDSGSIVVRARFHHVADSGANYLIYYGGGDPPNRANMMRQSSGLFRAQIGLATMNATSLDALNDTDIHTFGMSWSEGRFVRLYIDGVLQAHGFTAEEMAALDDLLSIGHQRTVSLFGVFMANRDLTAGEHARLHAAAESGPWTLKTLG